MLDASKYFKITTNRIYSKKVKENIKLFIVGDIHISNLVSEDILNNIVYEMKKEVPDYICLVGDIIDSPKELKNKRNKTNLINFIKEISSIAPTMIILGNHDYIYKRKLSLQSMNFWNELDKLNNIYLLNDKIYKDDKVFIMGYILKPDYYYDENNKHSENLEKFYNDFSKHAKLYKYLPNDVLKIGLIHSPEFINKKENIELLKEYDLLISGHNHGGCMPVILDDIIGGSRGIINAKKKLFADNTRGMTKLDTNTRILRTGGIVKLSKAAPKKTYILNKLCYRHMDTVIFTNKEKDNKKFIKKVKGYN